MNVADWGILAAIVFSVLLAAAQGFFFELFSLGGVIFGYLLAAWGYRSIAALFAPYVSLPWVADIAGFLTVFVAIVLLAGIIGRLVRWLLSGIGLRWFDRLLGAAFGLLRGIMLVTVIVLALAAFAPDSQLLVNSRFAPYVLVLGRGASWLAPPQVRRQFQSGVETLRRLHREREKDGQMRRSFGATPVRLAEPQRLQERL